MSKLYYENADTQEFEATVLTCQSSGDGGFEVTLNQTAFYPEGGGQPYDIGTLGETKVLEVHEKDGLVLHTTDRELQPGETVRGIIDWDRRFRYMQNHSGEHVFSGILNRRFGYDNVGFHMGTDAVTVDFNGVITPEELLLIEEEANRLIYKDVPIEILYPSRQELDELEYRSKKELTGVVRIVNIPDGDTCACCGTHVRRTGQIGMIKTTGMIHYKGGVRISMLCGMDALEDYGKRQNQVRDISHLLSAKVDLIVSAVEKLKTESGEKDLVIGRLYQQIFAVRIAAMTDREEPLVLFEEGLTPVQLRQFCTMLYEAGKGSIVAVCAGSGEGTTYALGSSRVDLRPVSKVLNRQLDGRGGGSSLMVQGIWNAKREQIEQAVMEL